MHVLNGASHLYRRRWYNAPIDAVISMPALTPMLFLPHSPWGTFEWDGAWSDKSPLWEQHPKVIAVWCCG